MADTDISLGAQISELKQKLGEAQQAVKGFADSAKNAAASVITPFEKLQSTMLAVASIAGGGYVFNDIVQSTLGLTAEVTRLQRSMGLTLDEANQTAGGLKLLGISTEDYTQMAIRLDRQVRTNNQSLQQMGFTARDLDLGQKGLMDKAIAKLLEYKVGVDRNIAAQVLFGRSAGEVYSLLNLGNADVIARAKELRQALDLNITEEDRRRAREYKISMGELGMAMESIKKTIGDALLPYLTRFAQWFVTNTPAINAYIREMATAIINGVIDAAEAVVRFGGNVDDLITKLATALRFSLGIGLALTGQWRLAYDMAQGVAAGFNKDTGAIEGTIAALEKLRGVLLGGGPKMPVNPAAPDDPMAGNKSAGGLLNNRDAVGAAMKEIDGQIKVLQAGLATKKVIYDAEASMFGLTQDKKFSLLQAAVGREAAEEMSLLQRELQIQGMNLTKRTEIENKIKELRAKTNLELVKLDIESMKAAQQSWGEWTSSIAQSFNGQIRGLLAGTTSFAQAFKTILGDLLVKFISTLAEMVAKWAAAELAKTTATTTGAAARAGLEQGSILATSLAQGAAAVNSILTSAAETFAGVFAFLSPVMGPAAGGPAAASEGAVASQVGAVALETGAYRIPAPTLALLHPNETVLPAPAAAAFRDMAEGGGGFGGATSIQLSFIDTAGAMNFIRRHARDIAMATKSYTALNPSTA